MIKVNFKQPKYIFPAVIFIPLCALVYFVMQTFGGGGEPEQAVATDRINTELPEAHAEEAGDKMYEMSRRFGDEDAFTAVGGIGEEKEEKEEPGHGYSEEELDGLDAAEAERIRQQQEMEELERSLAESRRHINSYAYGNNTRTTSPVTLRKSSAAATRGRRPSGAALGSATRKRKRRPKGSVPTRWRESARKRRNETARTLSSSLPTPMRTSSIRCPLPTVRRKPG